MSPPIDRLEAALACLGAEHEPPRGWETRVLAAVRPPARRGWWFVSHAMAVMAAIAIVLAIPHPPPDDALQLQVSVTPVGPAVRGSSAHAGDRVHASATGGGHHRAIWVYRNDRELVLACPGGPSCGSTLDATTAELTLPSVGTYMFVAVTSASPLPAPSGSYDADQAAAEQAGAQIRRSKLDAR
jgi:hypothetical protein